MEVSRPSPADRPRPPVPPKPELSPRSPVTHGDRVTTADNSPAKVGGGVAVPCTGDAPQHLSAACSASFIKPGPVLSATKQLPSKHPAPLSLKAVSVKGTVIQKPTVATHQSLSSATEVLHDGTEIAQVPAGVNKVENTSERETTTRKQGSETIVSDSSVEQKICNGTRNTGNNLGNKNKSAFECVADSKQDKELVSEVPALPPKTVCRCHSISKERCRDICTGKKVSKTQVKTEEKNNVFGQNGHSSASPAIISPSLTPVPLKASHTVQEKAIGFSCRTALVSPIKKPDIPKKPTILPKPCPTKATFHGKIPPHKSPTIKTSANSSQVPVKTTTFVVSSPQTVIRTTVGLVSAPQSNITATTTQSARNKVNIVSLHNASKLRTNSPAVVSDSEAAVKTKGHHGRTSENRIVSEDSVNKVKSYISKKPPCLNITPVQSSKIENSNLESPSRPPRSPRRLFSKEDINVEKICSSSHLNFSADISCVNLLADDTPKSIFLNTSCAGAHNSKGRQWPWLNCYKDRSQQFGHSKKRSVSLERNKTENFSYSPNKSSSLNRDVIPDFSAFERSESSDKVIRPILKRTLTEGELFVNYRKEKGLVVTNFKPLPPPRRKKKLSETDKEEDGNSFFEDCIQSIQSNSVVAESKIIPIYAVVNKELKKARREAKQKEEELKRKEEQTRLKDAANKMANRPLPPLPGNKTHEAEDTDVNKRTIDIEDPYSVIDNDLEITSDAKELKDKKVQELQITSGDKGQEEKICKELQATVDKELEKRTVQEQLTLDNKELQERTDKELDEGTLQGQLTLDNKELKEKAVQSATDISLVNSTINSEAVTVKKTSDVKTKETECESKVPGNSTVTGNKPESSVSEVDNNSGKKTEHSKHISDKQEGSTETLDNDVGNVDKHIGRKSDIGYNSTVGKVDLEVPVLDISAKNPDLEANKFATVTAERNENLKSDKQQDINNVTEDINALAYKEENVDQKTDMETEKACLTDIAVKSENPEANKNYEADSTVKNNADLVVSSVPVRNSVKKENSEFDTLLPVSEFRNTATENNRETNLENNKFTTSFESREKDDSSKYCPEQIVVSDIITKAENTKQLNNNSFQSEENYHRTAEEMENVVNVSTASSSKIGQIKASNKNGDKYSVTECAAMQQTVFSPRDINRKMIEEVSHDNGIQEGSVINCRVHEGFDAHLLGSTNESLCNLECVTQDVNDTKLNLGGINTGKEKPEVFISIDEVDCLTNSSSEACETGGTLYRGKSVFTDKSAAVTLHKKVNEENEQENTSGKVFESDVQSSDLTSGLDGGDVSGLVWCDSRIHNVGDSSCVSVCNGNLEHQDVQKVLETADLSIQNAESILSELKHEALYHSPSSGQESDGLESNIKKIESSYDTINTVIKSFEVLQTGSIDGSSLPVSKASGSNISDSAIQSKDLKSNSLPSPLHSSHYESEVKSEKVQSIKSSSEGSHVLKHPNHETKSELPTLVLDGNFQRESCTDSSGIHLYIKKALVDRSWSFNTSRDKEKSPAPSEKSLSSNSSGDSNRKRSSSLWYDEGISGGVLGDVESSDAAKQSSFDDVGSYSDSEGASPVRRRLSALLGSFGKGGRRKPKSPKGKEKKDQGSQFYCNVQSSSGTELEVKEASKFHRKEKVSCTKTENFDQRACLQVDNHKEEACGADGDMGNILSFGSPKSSGTVTLPGENAQFSQVVAELRANIAALVKADYDNGEDVKLETCSDQPVFKKLQVNSGNGDLVSKTCDECSALETKQDSKNVPVKVSHCIPESDVVKRSSYVGDQSLSSESFENEHSGSDEEDHAGGTINTQCGNDAVECVSPEQKKAKKVFYIAQEIMSSEKVFVNVLRLLNVEFRSLVERANKESKYPVIPETELNKIFSYIPQLQNLNENLLCDLEDRIESWDTVKRISDVIVEKGPFLKLYASYIKDFEFQCNYLDECCQKYPKFAKVVKEFEASEVCQKLGLKHYMLKPVQRIPQYRLLLEDYLKHLDVDSVDYADTVTALSIVSGVAEHANNSMKEGDNFLKLIQLQSRLSNFEIIRPGRGFIKEGELYKLCRKGMQPRYFILLSDVLLYTSYSGSVQSPGSSLRLNYELPLTGMKVNMPIAEDYKYEFSIISFTRSFTLSASSPEERDDWLHTLKKAIEENASKRSTFMNVKVSAKDASSSEFHLGKQAPVWIPDDRVTMCQNCTTGFTITFRRHHCRACGKVVCGNCSANRAPLEYLKFQVARVCEECFITLEREFEERKLLPGELQESVGAAGDVMESDPSAILAARKSQFKKCGSALNKKFKKSIPQRLKEVCANDTGSQMSGYLQKRLRKSWKRFWFVLKDRVLYMYPASEDVVALETTAVLGYQVETLTEKHFQLYEGVEANLVFLLTHPGRSPLAFHAENTHLSQRWIDALREATVL